MKEPTSSKLARRLDQHPSLKGHVEAILDRAENIHGDLVSADEAEQRALKQVRQLGNELLHDWAKQRVIAAATELKEQEATAVGNGKKK